MRRVKVRVCMRMLQRVDIARDTWDGAALVTARQTVLDVRAHSAPRRVHRSDANAGKLGRGDDWIIIDVRTVSIARLETYEDTMHGPSILCQDWTGWANGAYGCCSCYAPP